MPVRRIWPVAVVVIALVAAACGESDDLSKLSPEEALAEEIRIALGVGVKPDNMFALALSDSARRQDLIAECMGEAGFEYVPMSPDVVTQLPIGHELPFAEYVQRYGYGVVLELLVPLPSVVDSNEAIIDGLSGAAGQAWHSGREACWAVAYETVKPPGAVLEGYGDELAELAARVRADPRIVQWLQGWAACMSNAGFPGLRPETAKLLIAQEVASIMERWVEDGVVLPEGNIDSATGMPSDLVNELEVLQRREIEIATRDAKCQEPFVDRYRAILDEYGNEFVKEAVG